MDAAETTTTAAEECPKFEHDWSGGGWVCAKCGARRCLGTWCENTATQSGFCWAHSMPRAPGCPTAGWDF